MDNNISHKEITKMLVSETIRTQGWKIIEEEINRTIETAKLRLTTVDPENIVEISKLQERINTLKKTLQIVHNMVI